MIRIITAVTSFATSNHRDVPRKNDAWLNEDELLDQVEVEEVVEE